MNPYTSTWSGRHARRRPAGGARRPARQRPHQRARRRGRPAGAALHPLLGLPQRLPGLRAHRRPRLRLGLPRPDRRDPQPAAATASARRAGRLAAVRVVALRCLLRGLPGAHRHPVGARRPARPGRRRAPRRRAQARGAWRSRRAAVAFSDSRKLRFGERVSGWPAASSAASRVDAARRPRSRRPPARPRRRLDRCTRPARPADGVLPRVVGPHRRWTRSRRRAEAVRDRPRRDPGRSARHSTASRPGYDVPPAPRSRPIAATWSALRRAGRGLQGGRRRAARPTTSADRVAAALRRRAGRRTGRAVVEVAGAVDGRRLHGLRARRVSTPSSPRPGSASPRPARS